MAVTRFKSEPRAPLPRVMSETTTRPAMTVRSPRICDSRNAQALWIA